MAVTTTSRLSILQVVLCLDCGGLERVVIDLAREMMNLQQNCSVLCVERRGILAQEIEQVGAKLYCAEKGPGLRWSAVNRIGAILDELQPDIIHTHQMTALFYIALSKIKRVSTVVHTEHSNHMARLKTIREKYRYLSLIGAAGRRADRFFGVSQNVTESIRGSGLIPHKKLYTVPNGINLSRFKASSSDVRRRDICGIAPDAVVLGTVARLTEVKRLDILLDVFARIRSEFPKTHLLLVGNGPMMVPLQRQAAELKMSSCVHLVGFQEDPRPYLALLDIFVLTSYMEGMPLSVIEALAMGIPVVASRVGGLEEMSNRGKAILLYDWFDTDRLYRNLRLLICNSAYRRDLAQLGSTHVFETYSAKRMAQDYLKHYRDLSGVPLDVGRVEDHISSERPMFSEIDRLDTAI